MERVKGRRLRRWPIGMQGMQFLLALEIFIVWLTFLQAEFYTRFQETANDTTDLALAIGCREHLKGEPHASIVPADCA